MQIKITIKGTNSILLHKYTVASSSQPTTRITKTRDASNYADEWIKGTYVNKDGHVVMPSLNIMACIFDGAKGMKIGKKAITRVVYTSLIVQPFEPLLKYNNKPITINDIKSNDWLNMSGAVIKGNRVDRIRTEIPNGDDENLGWTIEFKILTKDDALSEKDIQAVLENAGKCAGLGDWRPGAPKKPGPYGTFEITEFIADK